LVVDIPKRTKPKRHQRRMIADIVDMLKDRARSMPDDAIVYGWPNGCRPANADNATGDDERMARWAKDRTCITIRIDPRNAGTMRVDSDMARQLGLIRDH
jgi:hypothetical protein